MDRKKNSIEWINEITMPCDKIAWINTKHNKFAIMEPANSFKNFGTDIYDWYLLMHDGGRYRYLNPVVIDYRKREMHPLITAKIEDIRNGKKDFTVADIDNYMYGAMAKLKDEFDNGNILKFSFLGNRLLITCYADSLFYTVSPEEEVVAWRQITKRNMR